MIFLADTDISSVPAEFVKNWWIMVIAFGTIGVQIWIGKNKERKISGKVQTEPAQQHAEQSDLDALTKTVDSLREEITSQFRAAQTAGENRVAAITQDVNEEMRTLSSNVGGLAKLITEALVDNAKQGAEIKSLQSSIYRHDAEVREIQNRIAELMRHPPKRSS